MPRIQYKDDQKQKVIQEYPLKGLDLPPTTIALVITIGGM